MKNHTKRRNCRSKYLLIQMFGLFKYNIDNVEASQPTYHYRDGQHKLIRKDVSCWNEDTQSSWIVLKGMFKDQISALLVNDRQKLTINSSPSHRQMLISLILS